MYDVNDENEQLSCLGYSYQLDDDDLLCVDLESRNWLFAVTKGTPILL